MREYRSGIYTAFSEVCSILTSGDVKIVGGMALIYDTNHFTLTCISTGGPATTVTWTRDSTTVTEGTETVLNDPVTAQYTHTLTVIGRLPGLYTCTVVNNKPSSDSASKRVVDGRLCIFAKLLVTGGIIILFQLICPCLPLHRPLWLETVSLSPAPSLPPVELVALQSCGGRDLEMEI